MKFKKEQLWINGRAITRGLFWELRHQSTGTDYVLMTFDDEDRGELISFPRLYREYCDDDPTEFKLAEEVFGSWEYWEYLTASPPVKPFLEKLRKENMARQKAKALRSIISESAGGKSKYAASKFLWDMGYEFANADENKKAVKETKTEAQRDVEKDMARLNLKLIKDQ